MPWSPTASTEDVGWQCTVSNSEAGGETSSSLSHHFPNRKKGQFLKESHLLLIQTPKINIFTRQNGNDMFLVLFLKHK